MAKLRQFIGSYCDIPTGVDITAKIEDMVKSVVTQKERNVDINRWANNWVAFSKSIVPTVISFIEDFNFFSKSSAAYEAAGTVEKGRKVILTYFLILQQTKHLNLMTPWRTNALKMKSTCFKN